MQRNSVEVLKGFGSVYETLDRYLLTKIAAIRSCSVAHASA